MSTIDPRKTLYVEYPMPPSRVASIRVAASEPVNVYAMEDPALQTFLKDKTSSVEAFVISKVGREHTLQVKFPIVQKWYLVIDNPWDKSVEVDYTVVALEPVAVGATSAPWIGTTVSSGATGASGPSGPVGVIDGYVSTGSYRR